jgi:hypothetical protein
LHKVLPSILTLIAMIMDLTNNIGGLKIIIMDYQ